VLVDEIAAVVRIDAQDREREGLHDLLQRLEDPLLGLVAHRPVDRPPGCDVGDGEGEAELPGCVATLVADQIDLDEPGHRVVQHRPTLHQAGDHTRPVRRATRSRWLHELRP
jgi:hypothetical protein